MPSQLTAAMQHRGLSHTYHLVCVVTVLACLVAVVDSLNCYQCGGTTTETLCETDYEGFVNTSRGESTLYAKNCTSSKASWNRCVIVTVESAGSNGEGGVITLYMRDCHDGVTFENEIYDVRFENLTANNFSTCAYSKISQKIICYRFCNEDYCNGPQAPPIEEDPCDNITTYGFTTCGAARIGQGSGPITAQLLIGLLTSLVLLRIVSG